MSGVHQRAAAGVSLSSEAEVPQRPHKGVRQSAKTGELYLAHSVHKYTSVDFLMLQCQNHKEVPRQVMFWLFILPILFFLTLPFPDVGCL